MTIAQLIIDLDVGGAEMMLYKLSVELAKMGHSIHVISLTDRGPIAVRLYEAGIPVHQISGQSKHFLPHHLFKLWRLLLHLDAQIIQTWMYHADLVGGLVSLFIPGSRCVWNIRQSNLDSNVDPFSTRLIAKLNAKLSKVLPRRILVCSRVAEDFHRRLGYDRSKTVFVPNGFDLSRFSPDATARQKLRAELGLSNDIVLVGCVGRYHPQKDHETFLRAAHLVLQRNPNARFLLCGRGIETSNGTLASQLNALRIADKTVLLGERSDMQSVLCALDVCVSSACYGEAFPNILGEAMACGVPCVTTKVGDSADVVGDTGAVVDIKNPPMLAAAINQLVADGEKRLRLGDAARRRVAETYNIQVIAEKYLSEYSRMSCC